MYRITIHTRMFASKKSHPHSDSQINDRRKTLAHLHPDTHVQIHRNLINSDKSSDKKSTGKGSVENLARVSNPENRYAQRKPRKEVVGVAGKKLYVEHDAEVIPFKDYNGDGVIGHDKDRPYQGVRKGQVLSFTDDGKTYTAWFSKEGVFKGYYTGSPTGEHKRWHDPLQYSDFGWQSNYDRLRSATYTDGGHYIGDKDYEPTYAIREVTAELSVKLVYHFTTAEAIEIWNDNAREMNDNLETAVGLVVAFLTRKKGFAKSAGAGVLSSTLLKKLLKPKDIYLDPGGKLVFGTKMRVYRSTEEGSNDNGLKLGTNAGYNGVSMKYYTQVLNNGVDTTNSLQSFYGVQPYTNSLHEDFLQMFERYHGENSRTYVENPDHGMMSFLLRRTK